MTDDASLRAAATGDNQPTAGASASGECVERRELFTRQPVENQTKGRCAFIVFFVCYTILQFGWFNWAPLGPEAGISDTGANWEVFYATYVELFYRNDLAHWFPYGAYGQPNTLSNVMELTPSHCLVMAVGKLFHVKNAVLLFQLSLMADHLLFLFGIHLLSRSLFRRQSTVWLCLIGSIVFLYGGQLRQIQVFRMLAWYPLVLYCLVRFFRDHRAEALWMGGTLFTFSCLGNGYEQPWPLLALLPFVAVATWKNPHAWREVLRCRTGNLAGLALFAATALIYLYLALHALEGVETVHVGRDNSSGVVDLETFSGDKSRILTLYEVVLSFICGHGFYIGLLPLACVLWGLLRVRTPLFAVFVVSSLFFVWFALGGVLALALYHSVPFISLLHYIYMGFHFLPLTFLLAAAAAWDEFEPTWENLKVWLAFPLIALFAIDFSFYGHNLGLTPQNISALLGASWNVLAKLLVYGGLLGLAAILSRGFRSANAEAGQRWRVATSFRGLAGFALLTGLFVDVFQYTYRSGLPEKGLRIAFDPPAASWRPVEKSSPVYQACYVQPLTWQGERLDHPQEERKKTVLETPVYFYAYAFAQFDPCKRVHDWTLQWQSVATAMRKLLALRDENDPALKTLLGCHAPKLRLLSQALYVHSEAEAEEAVRNGGDLTNVVVLQWPADSPKPPTPRSPPAGEAGSVRVTDFGANDIEMEVNVSILEGAWLVYADAYDPRWRAWVNGKPVPIAPAYVGLKAVWVPHGESVVRMKFSAGSNVGVRVLAVGGALCSLFLLLYCGFCCVRGFPSSERKVSETLPSAPGE